MFLSFALFQKSFLVVLSLVSRGQTFSGRAFQRVELLPPGARPHTPESPCWPLCGWPPPHVETGLQHCWRGQQRCVWGVPGKMAGRCAPTASAHVSHELVSVFVRNAFHAEARRHRFLTPALSRLVFGVRGTRPCSLSTLELPFRVLRIPVTCPDCVFKPNMFVTMVFYLP